MGLPGYDEWLERPYQEREEHATEEGTYCFTIKITGRGLDEEAAWFDALKQAGILDSDLDYASAKKTI